MNPREARRGSLIVGSLGSAFVFIFIFFYSNCAAFIPGGLFTTTVYVQESIPYTE